MLPSSQVIEKRGLERARLERLEHAATSTAQQAAQAQIAHVAQMVQLVPRSHDNPGWRCVPSQSGQSGVPVPANRVLQVASIASQASGPIRPSAVTASSDFNDNTSGFAESQLQSVQPRSGEAQTQQSIAEAQQMGLWSTSPQAEAATLQSRQWQQALMIRAADAVAREQRLTRTQLQGTVLPVEVINVETGETELTQDQAEAQQSGVVPPRHQQKKNDWQAQVQTVPQSWD